MVLAQEKVFEELNDMFANSHRPCTTQDVANLKYLECCIKETLRLYPSVPAIMRRLTEDVQTGNLIYNIIVVWPPSYLY